MNKFLLSIVLLTSLTFAHNAPAKSSKGDFKRFCQVFTNGERPLDTDLYYYGYLYGAINMAKIEHLKNGRKITDWETRFMASSVCKEALKDKESTKKIGFVNTIHQKAYEMALTLQ